MSEGDRNSHQSQLGTKVVKKRRKLPTALPSGLASRASQGHVHPEAGKMLGVEKNLTRLSSEVLMELQSTENSDKFMPGEVKDITNSEFSQSGNKRSQITLRSGKKLDISLVEGSFRRITGIREQRDDSGSFLLRRVEIKREPGQSLGFYIREGDGWLRRDGVFVSRVNLGSSIETNGLLSVGDEIVRVNNVDVTRMLLDDVVLVMQFVKRIILTVKAITAFGFSSNLSLHKSLLSRQLPKPPSLADHFESGSQGRSSPPENPYSEVKSKRDIQERRLRFQRMKNPSHADSVGKSTNFGESFIKKLNDISLVEVEDSNVGSGIVINAYEEVSFGAKRDLAKSVNGIPEEESAEINPYARVSLKMEGIGPQRKEVGNESEEISPYARVALKVEGTGLGERKLRESGSCKQTGPPESESTEISPYAKISMRVEQGESLLMVPGSRTMTGLPESESGEVSPYARVSFKTGWGERVVVDVHPQRAIGDSESSEETRSRDIGGANTRDTEQLYNPYEEVANSSEMRMDSLVALLRANPIPSPSPAVKRRSDIVDDIVVSPDHIYAQIDRTRKYSSSGEEEEEDGEKRRSISTTTPPPAPTSPLPHDDSMSVLADIFSKPLLADELPDDGEKETKSSPSLTLHQETRSDPEITVPTPSDGAEFEGGCGDHITPTDEDLDLLGDEGPAPPLPPPYVPEEGPPDTSDEDDDDSIESDAVPLTENLSTSEPQIEPVFTVEELTMHENVEEPVLPEVEVSIDVEKFDGENAPIKVSTPIQQRRYHSFSSLPPPPPPPTDPPEDEGDSERSSSDQEGIEPFVLLDTSNQESRDGERDTSDENSVSGLIVLKVHGLNTTTEECRTFWSNYDVQKVTFVCSVDGRVKVTANLPIGERGISNDSSKIEEYQFLVFKSTKITFSVNPVCLPTISKAAMLCDAFATDVDELKQIYVDFESYGRLKLSLQHRPMSSVVRRVDGKSYSSPTFSDLVNLNPSNSGCPLVLEQCMEVIERYGLKTPHLYERCTPVQHKHRALAACIENLHSQTLKSVLVRCSVHAYTGLIVEFFQDLPEPFFTNDISSTLTQSASVDGTLTVLESFMLCLPEDVATTLNLLLGHFRRLIEHSERNGVTAKSIARLFGPLLLIPSLSPDLNTSATDFDYAEDYDSQAKVIELLLTRRDT